MIKKIILIILLFNILILKTYSTDKEIDVVKYFKDNYISRKQAEKYLQKYKVNIAKAYYLFYDLGIEIITDETYNQNTKKNFINILNKSYYKDYKKIFQYLYNYLVKYRLIQNRRKAIENIIFFFNKISKKNLKLINENIEVLPFMIVYPEYGSKFIKKYGKVFTEILLYLNPYSYPTLIKIFEKKKEQIAYIFYILKNNNLKISYSRKRNNDYYYDEYFSLKSNLKDKDIKFILTCIGLYAIEFDEITTRIYTKISRLFKSKYLRLEKYNRDKVNQRLTADTLLFLLRNLHILREEKKEHGIDKILQDIDQLYYNNILDKAVKMPYVYRYYAKSPDKYKQIAISFIKKYSNKGLITILYQKPQITEDKELLYLLSKVALNKGTGVIQSFIILIDKNYSPHTFYKRIKSLKYREIFLENLTDKTFKAIKKDYWGEIDEYLAKIGERGDDYIKYIVDYRKYSWIPGYGVFHFIKIIFKGYIPTADEILDCVTDSVELALFIVEGVNVTSNILKILKNASKKYLYHILLFQLKRCLKTTINLLKEAFIKAIIDNSETIIKLIKHTIRYVQLRFFRYPNNKELEKIKYLIKKDIKILISNMIDDTIRNFKIEYIFMKRRSLIKFFLNFFIFNKIYKRYIRNFKLKYKNITVKINIHNLRYWEYYKKHNNKYDNIISKILLFATSKY